VIAEITIVVKYIPNCSWEKYNFIFWEDINMHIFKVFVIVLIFTFLFAGCGEKKEMLKISADDLYNKVYGSWLAQIIGNIYGLPHENAYVDEPGPDTFPYGYGRNLNRLTEAKGAFSDFR
jgi:hypothetical protein